uniref:HAT C-terminal dimerisation domain-containing protein n=1 Tax=Ditylenchus dipsaci TaxID=166011 RepID=A0A915E9Q2_9BILA
MMQFSAGVPIAKFQRIGWKDIAKLALEILAITGTNTPVERVFSQCGLATARHRNRTNCQLLDSQLIVYLNSYCYEK